MTNSCFQDVFRPRLYHIRTAGQSFEILACSLQQALLSFWELFPEMASNAVQANLADEWSDNS